MRIDIKQLQAPGDLLCLSAAIRNLHICYPNQFEVNLWCYYPEIFYNSPDINGYAYNSLIEKIPDLIDMDYGPYLNECRSYNYHFIDCFIYMLNQKLHLNIKRYYECPCVYLNSDDHKKAIDLMNKFNISKPFWLLNAGIKNDIPLKGWPVVYYQQLIKLLNLSSSFKYSIIQVGSSNDVHPELDGVINLVGKTSLRELFALVYYSDGVISNVSMLMHLASAFMKPNVTIAGGREESNWEQYSYHIYLDTIGYFDCCKDEGCWKKQPDDCDNFYNGSPNCMWSIVPEDIINNGLNLF